jgi:hypothetical protein
MRRDINLQRWNSSIIIIYQNICLETKKSNLDLGFIIFSNNSSFPFPRKSKLTGSQGRVEHGSTSYVSCMRKNRITMTLDSEARYEVFQYGPWEDKTCAFHS